ncbi:peptide chain release factor 1 [Sedimentibacter sp. zth1]|uniref:peptide chain release factor 1 n=1 Tax=Sedimentibacter sp. zth1 TaxID=2816908 RepID=UPI001A912581|nr:peptide chain release factor 1 [Sedimentibacter sp. zth1]QSX05309.1 peptide chain release factor 1 [Sedimentibacter sp. zth1]
MLDKLDFIEEKYRDISEKIADPDIIANMNEWKKLVKEHAQIEPIVNKYKEYKDTKNQLEESKEMIYDKSLDEDFREMAKEEVKGLTTNLETIEEDLKILLLPTDPNDDKDVIVEVRAGVGGDEAGLFAGNLFRMYTRYAERQRWKTEIISLNDQGVGIYKEAIFAIKGQGAYSKLKYESGVHRVQRVPETESSGRIHTSSATVAVLPEVDDVEVEINQNDIKIDVFRSSGNGGQCVNTTDSAVRLTHIPTGIVISCQDEKSQLKNRDKAMKVLKAKLYDRYQQEQHDEIASSRKSQVGSGDRSERIRTYNYPQSRVTDHRIGLTLYKLDSFIDGDLEEMIQGLITSDQAEKLKNLND